MKTKVIKNPTWERGHVDNTHLDWDKLCDGKCYQLQYTPDSTSGFRSHPTSFIQLLQRQCRVRGLSVKTCWTDLETIQFQFIKKSEKQKTAKAAKPRKAKTNSRKKKETAGAA